MQCPNCGCGRESITARFLRWLGNEIRIAETPEAAPPLMIAFARFREERGVMLAVYKVSFTPANDPNNRGYKLYSAINGAPSEQSISDGAELRLPADGSEFVAMLVPIGPDNNPRPDRAGPPVTIKTEVYKPEEPPNPEVQTAPAVSLAFVRFENEDGTPPAA